MKFLKIQTLKKATDGDSFLDIGGKLNHSTRMTSANVTNFRIERNGEVVGEHSQHAMCHTRWHRLYKFTPFKEHTITSHWLDEDEVYHEGQTIGLSEFMANHQPKIADMRRMTDHIEKQNALLKELAEKIGDSDKALKLRILNSICYSPL
jgi:hypothetical protein